MLIPDSLGGYDLPRGLRDGRVLAGAVRLKLEPVSSTYTYIR